MRLLHPSLRDPNKGLYCFRPNYTCTHFLSLTGVSQFPASESDDQVWPHTRCVHAMLSMTQGNVSQGFVMFWKSNKSRLVSNTTTNRQLFPATPEQCAYSFQTGIVFPPASSSHSSGAV